MTGKYAVGRRESLIPVRDGKALRACIDAALFQNNDIVYELVPVGFVADGIFRKAPDATAEVLAFWDGKRVVPEPLYTVPIYKMEAVNE